MFRTDPGTRKGMEELKAPPFNPIIESGGDPNGANKELMMPERPRVVIKNDVGDSIGALNDGADIEVTGNAGNYAGDGMTAGELTVNGNAGDCLGNAMGGGVIFVRGNAGNCVGQSLKGGTVIVAGDVGDFAGAFMVSGLIMVCGNAGRHVGDSMVGGRIFVKGRCKSLELNVEQQRLTNEDKSMISKLSSEFKLGLPQKGMKKICPRSESPI